MSRLCGEAHVYVRYLTEPEASEPVLQMERQQDTVGPPRGALASANNHAIRQGKPQPDWVPNHSELDQLRHFLAERPDDSGPPLELLQPDDPELGPKAKKLMERDGYAIIVDALSSQQLEQMRQATQRAIQTIVADERTAGGRNGNRGGFRFSFGSAFMMGLIEAPASLGWHVLVDPPAVSTALCAIFESDNYRCTGLAGDFCMPGCNQYQQMHDDMGGAARELDRCPFVVVNYPMVDFTKMNGPMRIIPGTMQTGANGEQKYVNLDEEPVDMLRSTLVGCPAGAAILRDPRTWHGIPSHL